MSRNSTVNLFGELKLTKLTGDRRTDGRWSPTARLLVATDLPQLGGVHSVVAFSHLAMETLCWRERAGWTAEEESDENET